ncbi:MAG: PD-(D/E)XK nuclease family protein [Candidatus Xenobia bacterium]
MRLIFGGHFDAGTWPHPLHARDALAGECIVGPQHFLTLLETHLGLGGTPAPECLRTSAFRKILHEHDNDQQFYHRSFSVDPWGVATRLLSWHDMLVDAGWDGHPVGDGRLKQLTTLPAPSILGIPARVNQVAHHLRLRPRFIDQLHLADPPHAFPPAWQRLLAQLNPSPLPQPAPPQGDATDVGRLRSGSGQAQGDGSVVHVRGRSPWESAEILAAWLSSGPDLGSAAIVCSARGDILDTALRRYDLPCIGSTRSSPWRPATQVLPLLLALGWKPLDPYRLLEFLTLPRTPLPFGRQDLAQSLRDAPGIGGPVWTAAFERALQRAENDEERDKNQSRFDRWIGGIVPLAHFDRSAGMPVSVVADAAGHVAQWAMSLLALPDFRDDPALHAARSQATALKSIALDWSDPVILPRHLERMLSELASVGIVAQLFHGETGRLSKVASPGAIVGPAETIIWWNFVGDDSSLPESPWSSAEQARLRDAGIMLPDIAHTLQYQVEAWKQPIRWAHHRLVFVSWEAQGHASARNHPLFDEIQATFCPHPATERLIAVAAGDESLLWRPHRTPLGQRNQPASREHWTIDADLIARRTTESFSSIEMLIECPLRWTLHYAANVRGRVLTGVADHELLSGTLAHHILEFVVTRHPLPDPQTGATVAAEEFDRALPLMAAPFLLPSRATERLMLRDSITRAASRLVEYLHDTRQTVADVEAKLSGTLNDDTALDGAADLLLLDDLGQRAVLDLKWSSSHYQKKLSRGTAVQLALYAHLVQTSAADYYGIREARVMTNQGPDMAATFQTVVATWSAHMNRLAAGSICATGHAGIQSDKIEAGQMVLQPPCRFCEHRLFCGVPS